MVTTRQELLDAIRARPEDDHLRLAYADALEAAGDVEQAEFIRIGIAIAQDRATAAQKARAAELESLHGERFVGPVLAKHTQSWSFRRGLVDTIRNVPPCTLADHADEILGSAPIRTIVLGDADDDPYDGSWEQWPEHTRTPSAVRYARASAAAEANRPSRGRLIACATTAATSAGTSGASADSAGASPITMSIISLPGIFPRKGGRPVRHW